MNVSTELRGNVHTPFADRAKEYAWALCLALAPRKITPMDVDFLLECGGRFCFFEMKTTGAEMPAGQRIALEQLLLALAGRSLLLIVEHPPLARVELPQVLRFSAWTASGGAVKKVGPLPGSRFPAIYAAFFKWAGGDVNALRTALSGDGSPLPLPSLTAASPAHS